MDEALLFAAGAVVTITSVTLGAAWGPFLQERYARRSAKRAGRVALLHLLEEVRALGDAVNKVIRRRPGFATHTSIPTLSSRADDLSEVLTIDELSTLMAELPPILQLVAWYQGELQGGAAELDEAGKRIMASASTDIENAINTITAALKR